MAEKQSCGVVLIIKSVAVSEHHGSPSEKPKLISVGQWRVLYVSVCVLPVTGCESWEELV